MDAMEDTEWKDALIKHGIIKPDPKPVEEEVEPEPEVIKFNNSDDEEAWLDEKDDDEFIRNYREQRLAEIKLTQLKARFGEVLEITAVDYVKEVNQAGEDIYVVLLLYRQAHPMSGQMQNIFTELAAKFKETKFLKSISTLCIPNFPDENLPAVFIYRNGQLIKQLVGPLIFGTNKITTEEVEWIISRTGAVQTTLEEDPRKKMHATRKYYKQYNYDDDEEESD